MDSQVVFDTWDHQGTEGYVFLSTKKDGKWKDHPFRWPEESKQIEYALEAANEPGTELYWCPLIFSKDKRRKEYVLGGKVLYADLDEATPHCDPRPTVAWESSPSRYQALWYLDTSDLEPQQLEKHNKELTRRTNADPGGWDLTQVLRVPGSWNNKYDTPVEGRLLWANGPKLTSLCFTSLISLLEEHKVPLGLRTTITVPPGPQDDRSRVLYKIEHELHAAGVPRDAALEILKLSPWNKYAGRRDEDERLNAELDKVYADPVPAQPESHSHSREAHRLTTAIDLLGRPRLDRQWLIEDIWLKDSQGMIAGEPKTFKSMITTDIAVSVVTGSRLWGEHEVHHCGPVLIVQNENSDYIVQERLLDQLNSRELLQSPTVAGNTLTVPALPPGIEDLYLLSNTGWSFSTEDNKQELEDYITLIRPRLIIFDPLYLMFAGDVNSAQELQPILAWAMDLKNTHHTSVCVVHHWNKAGQSRRGGQRMLGSTTLHGWTESALYLEETTGEEDEVKQITVEREFRGAGAYPKLNIQITFDEGYSVNSQVAAPQLTTAGALDLLELYPDGRSTQALSRELGISRSKVDKAMNRLARDGVVDRIAGPKGAKLWVRKEV